MEAKLTQLCQYLGERLDSTTDRQAYMAYSIAKIKVQNILFEMLDKALADSMRSDDEEFV